MKKTLSCFEVFFIYEKQMTFLKSKYKLFLNVNFLFDLISYFLIVYLYFIRYNIFIGITSVAVLIFS